MAVKSWLQRRAVGYLASVVGVVAVALLMWPLYPGVRAVTPATTLLVVVLLIALTWGTKPALFSSFLGVVYLNFFYDPPTLKFHFELARGEDLIAVVAFLISSVLVAELSSRAQSRTRKIQELYDQLRAAFDRASQLEAIKQSERLKSALLDSVTHDLRTPLTSIKAAATALVDIRNNDSSSAPTENLLGIIVQQSDRLNHFIEGMIELAKAESSGEREQRKWDATPMEEIIVAALARAEDALRNHEVVVDCEENLEAAVSPHAIAQVLFSLLENAGRYAPRGTTIRVTARQDGSDMIQVAIEDQGPGIPWNLRDKVFEKFFRGDVAEGQGPQAIGLGLGLTIARGIVEAQGGKIWTEDRKDGQSGARFVFTAPVTNKPDPISSELERTVPQ